MTGQQHPLSSHPMGLNPPTCTQEGFTFRAIKLNIKLFRWDRALELAQQHKQHVDTVLWYRQRCAGVRGVRRLRSNWAGAAWSWRALPHRRRHTRISYAAYMCVHTDTPAHIHGTHTHTHTHTQTRTRTPCPPRRYLASAKGEETLERFVALGEQAAAVDGQLVRQQIQEEKAKEASRPGAKRYL